MSLLQKKWIAANAIDQSKIRLANNAYLRARNAADSADINIAKVNASDRIEFASVPQVTSDPASANDLVRKSYVDSVAEGLKPKQAVRVASLANIDLSDELEDGDVIDGITLATGDRVLVKDQTLPEENGIYIVSASGAASRSSDFDSLTPIDEINGAYTFVQEGTQAGQGWVESGVVAVLDTDPIVFVYFNSAASLTEGNGIDISSNVVSVKHDGQGLTFSGSDLALELDGGTLSKSASGVKVADAGITGTQIAASVAGAGLAGGAGSALSVNVDDSTIEINSDSLRVKASGITANELASDSVTTIKILDANVTEDKLASDSVSTAKIQNDAVDKDKIAADVAGNGLGQNVDGSLEVKVDDSTIEISADAIRVKDGGITNAKVAAGIDAAKIADGSVSNTEFQYINSLTSNAQTQISARIQNVDSEQLTLDATDISNGYKDLSFAAYSASSISVTPMGGPMQERGVDYTVGLNSGVAGVTRITFAGDLLNLEDGDKLIVQYARL